MTFVKSGRDLQSVFRIGPYTSAPEPPGLWRLVRASMGQEPAKFVRVPILRGELVLIESTCTRCLGSEIVSAADDSLERWEANHVCQEPAKSKDNVTPMEKR